MHIDATTLLIVSLIMAGLLTGIWFICASLFESERKVSIQYALTNMFLGAFLFLYAYRSVSPTITTYVLIDITFLLGCLFIRRSVEELTQVKKNDIIQLFIIFLILVIEVPSKYILIENKLTITSTCLFAVYALYHATKNGYNYMIKILERKYCLIVLFPIYSIAILTIIRIIVTLVIDQNATDLRNGSLFNTLILFGMLFSLLGFNAMAIGLVISKMIAKTKRLSEEDHLTKTFNRRHLEYLANKEILITQETRTPFSIIMLDIDHFKKINDTYGHAAGDCAIVSCVNTIKKVIRSSDHIGRLGGEEFCILLPNTQLHHAAILAERIRETLQNETVKWNCHEFKMTASFGLSSTTEDKDNQWSSLLHQADEAMYQAKKTGRNRIVVGNTINNLIVV